MDEADNVEDGNPGNGDASQVLLLSVLSSDDSVNVVNKDRQRDLLDTKGSVILTFLLD